MLKKIIRAIAVAIVVLILVASPVLAITNPDAIEFYAVGTTPTYKVFYDVMESGDMLFLAEQYVHYVVTPNETASEAFLFQVLDTNGSTIVAAVPLNQYEAKPISIYMDATQVTTAGIAVSDNLTIRIIGNPLLFASSVNNTVSAVLGLSDYVDQLLGVDGGVATANPLRNFIINVLADDIETFDSPPAGSEYIETIEGVRYLTTIGGSIFLEGIPALGSMCPIAFKYSSATIPGDTPESTGAYASSLSPLAKWGETSANGLTNLGVYLGINQALAGSMMLLILASGLAIYAYTKTQSGIIVLLMVGTTPFLGAWLGLMPIALAFIFTIVLVVLMGFFFLSRGAL